MAKRYTEVEKKKYVNDWKKSGLSITEYAKKNNIGMSSIARWRNAYAQATFGEIELSNNNQEVETTKNEDKELWKTKFVTNKIELYLKPGYDKQFLKSIVEVLVTNDC